VIHILCVVSSDSCCPSSPPSLNPFKPLLRPAPPPYPQAQAQMRLYGRGPTMPERLRSRVERHVDGGKLWARYRRNEAACMASFQLVYPQVEAEVRYVARVVRTRPPGSAHIASYTHESEDQGVCRPTRRLSLHAPRPSAGGIRDPTQTLRALIVDLSVLSMRQPQTCP
jgi:hypothetical protein